MFDQFREHFNNKKVVITGHTGFKGSWLSIWLNQLKADLYGISLDPPTEPSHYNMLGISKLITDIRLDIKNREKLNDIFNEIKPDYIFHLAAQSLVKTAYEDPINTWETNLMGTINVLDCVRNFKHKCSAVIITSDKCYDNQEVARGYKETDRMGGTDPYSASKGSSELAFNSFFQSYIRDKNLLIRIASARAGNVIGGGDWAENRIVPDCIKKWSSNKTVDIRNPNSTRPWQHVLEPLSGYLTLAIQLNQNESLNGESFNFGPPDSNDFTVKELVDQMSQIWGESSWNDVSGDEQLKESNLLKLDCEKALKRLNWHSTLNFNQTLEFTVNWYKSYFKNNASVFELTLDQIQKFNLISHSK